MGNLQARRGFIRTGLAIAGAVTFESSAQESLAVESEVLSEEQFGDPDVSPEALTFDPFRVQRLYGKRKAKFQPRVKNFGEKVLAVAQRYVGKNRSNSQPEIAKFLSVFDLGFRDSKGKYVPYCAAGVSFVAALAYVEALHGRSESVGLGQIRSILPDIDHHHFFPSPSVLDMYHVAAGKHRWRSRDDIKRIQPGALVVFDWKKNGGANHVGIVERIEKNLVHTIEFNTSTTFSGNQRDGGQIARKTRPIDTTVKGFIATNIVTAI